MPENIKTLRRRIRSVASTRKITRTMEMISTAKLRRVQNAMVAARPYAAKIQDLIMHLARSEAAATQPLFARRENGHGLTVLVIASDRGLCGGYNSSVLRLAENYIAENGGKARVDVFTVGKRARDFLGKRDYHVVGSEIGLGGNIKSEVAHSICQRMIERFLNKETDRIVLIYNSYVSAVAYKPVATQFLPLSAEEMAGEEDAVYHREINYIFEPNAERVFEQLIPRYVQTKIYSAMLEAMTSEHNARRIAMNSATENCQEMISSLTLRANKARQAAITKEILEIVGGAEALKG